VVDAIQTLGVLPVDVEVWGVDMLAAGSHKWLMCPAGTGLFYCRHDLLDDLKPGGAYVGAFSMVDPQNYLDYNLTLQPSSARFVTSAWNFSGFVAMRAALELIQSVGIGCISQRVLLLATLAAEDLELHGITVVSPRDDVHRSSLVLFDVPDREAAHARLLDAGVITSLRGQALRISPHFWNTEEEVRRVSEVLCGT
jgi:selenocysteine lyase/cysteine desulfurase